MNILIPMAGAGSRFEKAGYKDPKPLIKVFDKPMISWVVNNVKNDDAHYIFIAQKEHCEKYDFENTIKNICKKYSIIQIEGITEGAACTTLLAKHLINNDDQLITANSDQYVEWSNDEFKSFYSNPDLDGNILIFNSNHPKWSYVKTNNGYVTEVKEKVVISDMATVGIYYWKKGSDYVKCAEQMINNNDRFNNEFYVCPVFNYAVKNNKKIGVFNIKKMWGLGTPEDLEYFHDNF